MWFWRRQALTQRKRSPVCSGVYPKHRRLAQRTCLGTGSQSSYGLRELVEVDEELWSDDECASRANALLASLKDPAE
jgi:hypothetical protein